MQIRPYGIPAFQLASNAIHAGLIVEFLLIGSEQVIPDHENAHVIAVQVDIVLGVVDPVVRWSLYPAIERAHASDQLRVRPELVKELRHTHHQKHEQWNATEGHRQIEDPTEDGAGAGLTQRGGQIEFFALMMDHMGSPEQSYRVAPAVVPVVTEIVENEREDPGRPVVRGQMDQGPAIQQLFVKEDAQEAKEHPHAGAHDAAA